MIRIETSEDPNDKDFARFFIKLNTTDEFLQLTKYIEIFKKYGIKVKQGEEDEKDKCNGKFYLECKKKQIKEFMRNGFSDRICKNCNKTGKRKEMKVCKRCRMSWYCSKECQTAQWEKHKKYCTKFK